MNDDPKLRVLRTWEAQGHLYAEMEIDDERVAAALRDPATLTSAFVASSTPVAYSAAPQVGNAGEPSLGERCRRVVDDREERVRDLLGLARGDGDRLVLDALCERIEVSRATHPVVPRGEVWLAPTAAPRMVAELPDPMNFDSGYAWHEETQRILRETARRELPIRITGVLGPDA